MNKQPKSKDDDSVFEEQDDGDEEDEIMIEIQRELPQRKQSARMRGHPQ
jgi:hypothetical protein